jgi:small subunit ribosomal protein S16
LVKLRLIRFGKAKRPFYRVVAIDNRSPRQGQMLAQVGTYDPIHAELKLDEQDARQWLDRGAQMTETVEALLRSQGILARWRGLEGTVKANILKEDKPKRRRKLGKAAAEAAQAAGAGAPDAGAPEQQ